MNWNLRPLGEITNINVRNVKKDFPHEVINYFDISSVGSGVVGDIKQIELNTAPSRAKRLVKDGDTILATVRPGNKSYYYFKDSKSSDVVSTGFAVIEADNKQLDSRFLYYTVTDESFTNYLVSVEKGANYPAVTADDIKKAKVQLPPLPTQQKISHILSTYDDLIENNLKRIKLMEEMVQITYEQWFVRMKFPRHETTPIDAETGLPEGWEHKPIGALLNHEIGGGWGKDVLSQEFSEPAFVIRGTDFDSLTTGSISEVPFRFHKKSNLASRKLQHGDIVFEVSGGSHYAGVARVVLIEDELLNQLGKSAMCASFCKLARVDKTANAYLLFHFFRFLRNIKGTEVFEIRSASNIVNYNWTAFLKFQQILIPTERIMQKFYQIAAPIHKELYQLGKQNQLLKEARDILLPRLMTGMIDVDHIELPAIHTDKEAA